MRLLITFILLLSCCSDNSGNAFLGKVVQDGSNILVRLDDGNMVLVSSDPGKKKSFSFMLFNRNQVDFLLTIFDDSQKRRVFSSEIDEMGIPQLVIVTESSDGGESVSRSYRVEYELVSILMNDENSQK
jgi:hypothetical protein